MQNLENSTLLIMDLISKHRDNAYRKVNEELVTMYFEIGKLLSDKVSSMKWGSKVIDQIAHNIKEANPTLKGFDRSGLFRMIQFYETYKNNEIVAPLVRQISWSNNIVIFSHKSSLEEKEFYICLCIKNNYSKRELERQINSQYYERYLLSNNKTNNMLNMPALKHGEVNTRILDMYSLEFLDLPKTYKEKNLRDAIVDNMKDFILEIGKDFSFIGKEYRVHVSNKDYFIDLLFYNRTFSCLVAFELKIDDFKPSYISKMNFYLEVLDKQERRENENPSIGIILCASKDDAVVEYAMSRINSPITVSEYSTKLINKDLLCKKMIELKKHLENEKN